MSESYDLKLEEITAVWESIQSLKEAVDFIHSDLKDAGIEFENEENILFWIKEADDRQNKFL